MSRKTDTLYFVVIKVSCLVHCFVLHVGSLRRHGNKNVKNTTEIKKRVEEFKVQEKLSLPLGVGVGWRSGESTRLPPMWVEFVVGSLPCSQKFFTPVFPSPQKPAFLNSNSTRNQVDEEPVCGCATSKSLYIFLFFLFICCFTTWCQTSFDLSYRSIMRTPLFKPDISYRCQQFLCSKCFVVILYSAK